MQDGYPSGDGLTEGESTRTSFRCSRQSCYREFRYRLVRIRTSLVRYPMGLCGSFVFSFCVPAFLTGTHIAVLARKTGQLPTKFLENSFRGTSLG